MNDKIKALLDQLKAKEYKSLRLYKEPKPIIFPIDYFGFNIGSPEKTRHCGSNNTPDYEFVINTGYEAIKNMLSENIKKTDDNEKKSCGLNWIRKLDECIRICDEHRELARETGNTRLYEALGQVPRKPARSFYEACLFMKISTFFLRTNLFAHLGLGRFDQYMYPFYLRDKQNGVSDEELFEILEAFFISLNYDTDLYAGVQLGDNGQSLVLGGFDLNGNYMYNELSEKCMQASLELNLIDPKINLRVGKKTPDEVFILGTRLTQKGLGFPQYSNDDVVIPGLIKLGYEPKDAADYVVAACWEFLIQKKSFENANAATMNFPLMVSRALSKHLKECKTFLEFLEYVKEEIKLECDAIVEKYIDLPMSPPSNGMISLYYKSSVDSLTDVFHHSTKYRNWGCHGAGIANAADALAAVKKAIFEDKKYSADELLAALNDDFCGHEEMRNYLRSCPKMGNNDDYVDSLAIEIMDSFQKNLNGRPVAGGGIWRAGTGASLEYISEGEKCPATADGRKAKEPFASSFSPSLDVKPSGVLSVIQSFTKYDMTNIINGGPLTLEIHENLLRNEMGIEKVASLVKTYVELGGHQLQLNSINRETLIDAQKHPEKYPNLIVRVWGWSGYFNELHKKYQDHIIRRFEY